MTPSAGSLEPSARADASMTDDDRRQLEWEARAGRPAAAAAFGAALLPFLSFFVLATAVSAEGEETAGFLDAADDGRLGVIAAGALSGIGMFLLPVALGYLFRAARARRGQIPGFVLPLLAIGAIGSGAALIVEQVLFVDVASDFTSGEEMSEEVADNLVDDSPVRTAQTVRLGLNLAVGFAVIFIALNAMRAGLLSRFVGIIGIGVGAFYVLPFFGGPVLIQVFWLTALGLLFLGRWPGGERGPAWSTVEAIPWPGTAERLEAQRREAEATEGGDGQAGSGEGAGPGAERAGPRPASRKRRRGR